MRARARRQTAERLPSIAAVPFLPAGAPFAPTALTEAQRQLIRDAAARLRVRARTTLYEQESPANWLFVVAEGVIKTFRDLPSGKRRIAAFHFQGDIFGLARRGRYVNGAVTVTPAIVYRVPFDRLTTLMRHDADLQFVFLTKVTQQLRAAQRRTLIASRRDAAGRLAMFLLMLRQRHEVEGREPSAVQLPMTRVDIAGYLCLSVEAMSRAAAELARRRFVEFPSSGVARIVDEKRLAKFAADI